MDVKTGRNRHGQEVPFIGLVLWSVWTLIALPFRIIGWIIRAALTKEARR